MTEIEEIFKRSDVSRFQKELADFIVKNNLKTIIETGAGVSSVCILKAWDENGIDGKLYSIDPAPWCGYELHHPKYELIRKKSVDAMADLYNKTGAWDLFLHDGNHDILCQTYEYDFAYGCLKNGGWLVSDDVNWGNNGAWDKFCKAAKKSPIKLGSLQMVQRIFDEWSAENYGDHQTCLKKAIEAEQKYVEAGNKLTPYFQ